MKLYELAFSFTEKGIMTIAAEDEDTAISGLMEVSDGNLVDLQIIGLKVLIEDFDEPILPTTGTIN